LAAQAVCSDSAARPSITGALRDKMSGPLYGCADSLLAGSATRTVIDEVLFAISPAGGKPQCDGTPEKSALQTDAVPVDAVHHSFTILLNAPLLGGSTICLAQSATPADPKAKRSWTKPVILHVHTPFNDHAPLGAVIGGIDVSAASATDPQAVLLGLAVFDIPLSNTKSTFPDSGVFWASGQLGIRGMAQPSSVSDATSASFYTNALGSPPDHIVRSLDASAHLAYQFKKWTIGIGSFDAGAAADPTAAPVTIATISGLAGGGIITPLSATQANPQMYQATTAIMNAPSLARPVVPFDTVFCAVQASPKPPCDVTFVPADRTHFYRFWDTGFRFKLYGRDNTDDELRFPMLLDITLGQNSYVTGGKLVGCVLHIGGTMPIPLLDGLYFFGSLDMSLSETSDDGAQLLLLADTTKTMTFASPHVYSISVPPPNRDRYQIGVGLDLTHLLLKLKTSGQPATPAH
jgi:hypothetical protein